jgi:hypothetical protein
MTLALSCHAKEAGSLEAQRWEANPLIRLFRRVNSAIRRARFTDQNIQFYAQKQRPSGSGVFRVLEVDSQSGLKCKCLSYEHVLSEACLIGWRSLPGWRRGLIGRSGQKAGG